MPAKIELSGTEQFTFSPEMLFDKLTNFDQLTSHIPDLESSQRIDERTLTCVVRPGFSFLRGKVTLNIEFTELQRPTSAAMRTTVKGIALGMVAESTMAIRPVDRHSVAEVRERSRGLQQGGSQLDWQVRVVELKGLIATVSTGLVKAAAERVIGQSWQRLHAEEQQTAATSSPASSSAIPPAIDYEALREAVGDDQELLQVVLQAFLSESPQKMADLRAAIDHGDAKAVAAAAHGLKGCVRYFGETPAYSLAWQLETLGAAGRLDGAGDIARGLSAQLDLLRQAVTPLISST
jgi:carbon monoxide dehydrogenase subunit G